MIPLRRGDRRKQWLKKTCDARFPSFTEGAYNSRPGHKGEVGALFGGWRRRTRQALQRSAGLMKKRRNKDFPFFKSPIQWPPSHRMSEAGNSHRDLPESFEKKDLQGRKASV